MRLIWFNCCPQFACALQSCVLFTFMLHTHNQRQIFPFSCFFIKPNKAIENSNDFDLDGMPIKQIFPPVRWSCSPCQIPKWNFFKCRCARYWQKLNIFGGFAGPYKYQLKKFINNVENFQIMESPESIWTCRLDDSFKWCLSFGVKLDILPHLERSLVWTEGRASLFISHNQAPLQSESSN